VPRLKIGDLQYHTEDLSEEGIRRLESVQFVDHQIKTYQAEIDALSVAKETLIARLKEQLAREGIEPMEAE